LPDNKNVLFLASGRGSNFQSFVDHQRLGILKETSISAVICNHRGAQVVERAKSAGIACFEIEGVSGKKFRTVEERDEARLAFDHESLSISKTCRADYIVLAGFDQILTKSFIDSFPNKILNIHPAYDLKSFGGRNMVGEKVHEEVLARKMKYSGCSVHLVTASVDQGPAILKRRVDVLPADTPASLALRILEQEHLAFPEALQLLVDRRVIISDWSSRCYVDRYSENWDIEWGRRQQAYVDFSSS
jgi:phosphoribosylglycinamide formyltransferase-1